MTEAFIVGLIRLLNDADHAANKALMTKTTRERRRQIMRVGELVQDIQSRVVEALK